MAIAVTSILGATLTESRRNFLSAFPMRRLPASIVERHASMKWEKADFRAHELNMIEYLKTASAPRPGPNSPGTDPVAILDEMFHIDVRI